MKKIFSLLLLTVLAVSQVSVFAAEPLYINETTRHVTGGVTLTAQQRFYGDYSLNINCITADLKHPGLSLELLKDSDGVDKRDTVLNLAKGEEGTVAAINGDFFSTYKDDQNFSLGIEVKDGKLLQSHINADMAAGFVSENVLSLSYLTFSGEVSAPNETAMPLAHINKPTDYYGALLMYTPDYNGGVSPFLPNGITVVTVTDNFVSAKGVSLGGTVTIPENGYILVIDDNMTPFLDHNFNIEDEVKLTVSVEPSIENVDMAFGGGTLLLRDGKKTEITHNVSGNNPRSAIGTNEDGTVIYMITVDGRQTASRGVTLDALADICLEMGCINAINLDGGGSTAMVGKTFEDPELKVVNKPSETRKVINALAVTSDAEPGETAGFFIEAENDYVLSGDSVNLELTAYDKYGNIPDKIAKNPEVVVTGGKGYVKDYIYYSAGSGEVILDVYYNGEKTDSCTINIIDEVSGIVAPAEYTLTLEEGASAEGAVKVFDKAGKTAVVKNISLLNPEYDETFISLSDKGEIKALRDGGGQIRLSHGEAQRSIKVVCGNYEADADAAVVSDPIQRRGEGGFTMNIFASNEINTLFDRIVYAHAMDILESADARAIIGKEKPEDLTPDNLDPIVLNEWGERNYNNAKVITFDLETNVLRGGDQWKRFGAALDNAQQENIFIISDEPVVFSTVLEQQAFHAMLAEEAADKNVFVIYGGDENFCRIADGVRYMTVADPRDESMIHRTIENACYLSFNISENGVSYEYRKLYEINSEK